MHRGRFVIGCALLAGGLLLPMSWYTRTVSARQQTAGPVRGPIRTVKPLNVALKRAPAAGERGETYYTLESRIRRQTTHAADATSIVTERLVDGDVESTLRDGAGNEAGRFKIDLIDSGSHVLELRTPDGDISQAADESGARPTLERAQRQVYALWKDGVRKLSGRLQWRQDLMRASGAPATGPSDIRSIESVWDNGFVTTTAYAPSVTHQVADGKIVHGEALIAELTKDGVRIGGANWFPRDQVLVWDLPGVTTGWFDATNLATLGGWQFTPDAQWLNIQLMAFYDFAQSKPPRNASLRTQPTIGERIWNAIEPRLRADEPGCDDLHWLDGTIYRACCDVHDYCYAKAGCTQSSWWTWTTSWTCDLCNIDVVYCFATNGAGHVLNRLP
jgi:hypothetical protein